MAFGVKKAGQLLGLVVVVAGVVAMAVAYLSSHDIAVLEPAGKIGRQELGLIEIGGLLSVIVVVPVYIMTIAIVIRYRAGNKKAKYDPDFDHSRLFEGLWWGIPILIIGILSVVTWDSAHSLDPYKALSYSRVINVDVVALNWKWLFIYPDLNMASVNLLEFPTGANVHFRITSDTVMNSFWIPQLGSQIYAMPGMSTTLNLEADKSGSYNGVSANISGAGFSSMTFKATAVSEDQFSQWAKTVQKSGKTLDESTYGKLSAPTSGYPVTYYSPVSPSFYDNIVNKYMAPAGSQNTSTMGMMQ